MKALAISEMEQINGGGHPFVKWAGIATCAAAAFWPIGTAIAGPSCVGLVITAAST